MSIITFDLECYYDDEYSLRKLSTEAYILDPRFELIGFSIKVDNEPTVWHTGDEAEMERILRSYDLESHILLAQNTMFDAGVLSFRYGIHPQKLMDTMCMGRASLGVDKSVSLGNLAKHFGVGEKGNEVIAAKGKHRKDFTPAELAQYGKYCVNDTELTRAIADCMLHQGFPVSELSLIDLTLKMFTRPSFVLDASALKKHLNRVRKDKRNHLMRALLAIGDQEGAELVLTDKLTLENTQKLLRSKDKFAQLLKQVGIEPPTKVSPKTGKESWAFAKTDLAFKELAEHEDERVQTLVAARLGVSSTLEETRTQRFIDTAKRSGPATDGRFPIPLKYSGARTHRWSGCLVSNTEVLVYNLQNGIETKRITDVLLDDLVWDGEEFVPHEGVKFSGFAEVITWDGITGTPDHVVYTNIGPLSLSEAMQGQHRITTAASPTEHDVDTARVATGNITNKDPV